MHTQAPLPKQNQPHQNPSLLWGPNVKILEMFREKNRFVTYWWTIFPPFTLMVTYEL